MTAVQFSDVAAGHVEDIANWLKGNGRNADRFLAELQRATALLVSSPEMGAAFGRRRKGRVRRVLLRESAMHVYYVYRPDPDVVLVVAVWGARRGRGPKLVFPS